MSTVDSTEDSQREESPQDEEPIIITIDNRDPNAMHSHVVKMEFEDVIAEPTPVLSLEMIWKASNKTYTVSKSCWYRVLTTLFGIPLSLLWGLLFACVSFIHIWTIMPCIKTCELQCQCLKQLSLMCGRTFPMIQGLLKMIANMKMALFKND